MDPMVRVEVEYNPVDKKVQLKTNATSGLTVAWMLERAKEAVLQKGAEIDVPRIAVARPGPVPV